MNTFVELHFVDENGTGSVLKGSLRIADIIVFLFLPPETLAGANTLISIRGREQPVFVAETYEQVVEKLGASE